MVKQLRYYQEECLFSIMDYFSKKPLGNPICAIPCGLGKSILIAEFIRRTLFSWPGQRIMMMTHITELVQQNADELTELWEIAPVGLHAAELGDRNTTMPVIYGTIQSVAKTIKKAEEDDMLLPPQFRTFGWRDVLIIDEAHLLGPNQNSQYQYVIRKLKEINPNLVVIGFSATPFRMKQGLLTEGDLFTDICYDITSTDKFNRLIGEGFMCPLVPRPTESTVDVSEIKITRGEFNEKQAQDAADEVAYAAIKESVELGAMRKYWMVFAAGIRNCENVTDMLQSFGIDAISCHSKLKPKENEKRIRAYKNGEYRAIVGANKLTTGFNYRPIDLIIDLQPTVSTGKHLQKLGRGSRLSPETDKTDCAVFDFAGNVPRCGPINDPYIPQARKKSKIRTAPVKICPVCGIYNSASARYCGGGSSAEQGKTLGGCGHQFTFETKLFATAGTADIIKSSDPIVEIFNVKAAFYALHQKAGSAPSIKVTYVCGLKMFNEWVCLEHRDPVGKKAREWWRLRHAEEPPPTTHMALQRQKELRTPKTITVRLDKAYPEILSAEF